GDTSTFRFGELVSLKGYWNGRALAKATLEGAAGPVDFPAKTNNSNWGTTISGKSVRNETNSMWVTVDFPKDAAMARKSVSMHVIADVTYPFEMAGGFSDEQKTMAADTTVKLSDPGAGTLFYGLWWMGQLGLVVWILIAMTLLNSGVGQIKSLALPHLV